MKKLLILPFLILLSCTTEIKEEIKITDTVNYTNVSIQNKSKDSVLVYLTIQAPNSVVGIFGIQAQDTIGSCSQGFFYAIKDSIYNSNTHGTLLGMVISFQHAPAPCAEAISSGFRWGINIFECSINTPFEVFDVSCEDGVNSLMKVTVSDTLWTTGDGEHIARFDSLENKFPVEDNLNIRGVFPYCCTDCVRPGKAVPQNCLNLKDTCSLFRTCQVARTNHNGGIITVKYLGSPEVLK